MYATMAQVNVLSTLLTCYAIVHLVECVQVLHS